MNEKKFFIPGIVISAAALLLSVLAYPAEAILAAVFSLVLCIRNRSTKRVTIGIVLSVIACAMAAALLAFYLWQGVTHTGWVNYWLFQLLFGAEPA